MSPTTRDHAVVLGGGLAGLFAARILADHYDRVTIVERDRLPGGPTHRPGVPQAHHVHAMLPLGRQVADELFPGWTSELVAAGGRPGDILGNVRWLVAGGALRQTHTGLTVVSASRPLIEETTRRRVLALSNVELLDGYDIVGVRAAPDRTRITGARVTSRHGHGSRILPADLVVDATGRSSRTARWLAELGYPAPTVDRMPIELTYSTRPFAVPSGVLGDDIVVAVGRVPGGDRSGVMQRLEDGRTLITLAGVSGVRPPADLAGFTEFADSLSAPDIHEAVRAGRAVGPAVGFRMPTATRHRYERLTELPAGLLAVGDAVCALNPVYAQGMSLVAATMALLHENLIAARGGHPDPVRFYAAVARLVDPAWLMSVGADSSLPGIVAPPVPASPFPPGYLAALQAGGVTDVQLARAFTRVASLVDPPSALLRPEIAARVERAARPVPATAPRT